MIQLENVRKVFGHRPAVEDLSMRVEAGEICGLLGHNGAGKSTTIGMILGQVWPTAGTVHVCGHEVVSHREKALRRVGAIFETPAFYEYLSGRHNLEILSSYTAWTPPERVKQVLELVGLAGREGAKVSTYSHGMRARLALAQALLPDPQLLILDEPGEGLDPEGIHELRLMIIRLRAELGLTILLSSHLLTEVEQICTRMVVMNQGRKVWAGQMREAKRGKRLVRLKTEKQAGIKELREAGLILKLEQADGSPGASPHPELVEPAEGVGTDVLVEFLVEQGVRVFEVTPVEQTLEDFYLGLMKRGDRNASAS